MFTIVRKSAAGVAAVAVLGLGGSAIAGAADSTTPTKTKTAQSRPAREALSADVAAKVKAAALEKVPGATVLRTEAGGPYATAYHAHIKTSDGTKQVVLVDGSFTATAVQADQGRPGGRRGGPGGPGDCAPPASATASSSS